MLADKQSTERIPGYCALCVSRCGSIAVIEDGRFVALEPDPSHPTGKALCAKGRAAPELVYHPDRLLYPLKRTRPKGDPDPGWQRISWDEALDLTAASLRQIAAEHGPESVVFSVVSPSTSASDDSAVWIQRLMNAFGSPNLCAVDGAVRLGALPGHAVYLRRQLFPALTCPTWRMPAASCSGATTPTSPGSPMRPPRWRRSNAARA